ncbi:MAG: response regulator [bacterium]|nr:response regulator [bacterium]
MPRILFAEDALTTMDLAGNLLDDPHLTLDVIPDGRSVLDRLNAAPSNYDLVILGDDLPEISTLECIAYIRNMFRNLPILILATTVDKTRLSELANLGIPKKRVLTKPISRQIFADQIHQALAEIPPKRRSS